MYSRLAQGQAGVYTVAAQLLLRGVNPSFPAVDCGADILTDWGTRVQIKCSHRRPSRWGGSYHFVLTSGVTLYVGKNGHKKASLHDREPRAYSNECDFFVLWGIEDNRFWIIPSLLLDGKTSAVMVGKDCPWLRLDMVSIRRDSESGMSQRAIADKYQISQRSVLRVLHGRITKVNVETGFSRVLLSHENRWDLILAEENLLSEGEANLAVPASAEEV
jgi:hypothetical protein